MFKQTLAALLMATATQAKSIDQLDTRDHLVLNQMGLKTEGIDLSQYKLNYPGC